MIRFLSAIFKLDYEPCKGCDTLREQLAIANHEKAEMLDTILNLVKPQVIIPQSETRTAVVQPATTTWRHRQRELENSSRNQERIRQQQRAETARIEAELGLSKQTIHPTLSEIVEEEDASKVS